MNFWFHLTGNMKLLQRRSESLWVWVVLIIHGQKRTANIPQISILNFAFKNIYINIYIKYCTSQFSAMLKIINKFVSPTIIRIVSF